MTPTEGSASMFETVKKHGEVIDTYGEIIESHGESIKELKDNYFKLEENDKKQTEKLDLLSNQMNNLVQQNTKLESTILKSSQSQQDFFRDTMNKQWDLIKARDESKESERKRVHELNLSEQALKKTNAEKRWEFVGKLFLSGSIIYLIIESIFRMAGGQ